jgi:hypothetical protein
MQTTLFYPIRQLNNTTHHMNNNRSVNYLKTIINDKTAKDEILKVQTAAKIFNLEQKLAQAKDPNYARLVQRVDVYGRLGKNNPAALEYRRVAAYQRTKFTYGAHSYQRIAIKDAATIDIYVSCNYHRSYSRRIVF